MLALSGWMRAVAILPGALLIGATCFLGCAIRRWLAQMRHETVRDHLERMRELSTLQESLAHELKNPLASIKGLAGLIELEPERAPERLRVLNAEVVRMQCILDELLSFARPLTPLSVENVDLPELLGAVSELYDGWARGKHLELRLSTTGQAEARCDPRKVRQMVMNLLHNAIDASPDGSAIELTLARSDGRVQIAVHDRGCGVPPDQMERVCQAGVTTKQTAPGLGLTLARALAAQHGGTLALHNRDGGGLTALLDLPLRCPEPCHG